MSKLVGIATRTKKRAPMQILDKAIVSLERGVNTDFRGKPSSRQVTIMSLQAWQQANSELKLDLPWTTRRANLLVDELDLESSIGKTICIGEVELLVTQETDPCERMEEAASGLFDALKVNWRGGVCCRVIHGGQLALNDQVKLIEKPE